MPNAWCSRQFATAILLLGLDSVNKGVADQLVQGRLITQLNYVFALLLDDLTKVN